MRWIIFITGLLIFPSPVFLQLVDGPYSPPVKLHPGVPFRVTGWQFKQVEDLEWKPAKVPGTIIDNFTDLSDIPDPKHPYYGDNEKLYQWIAERDWEFHTTVWIDNESLADGSYNLYFEGLDVFADIFVNGKKTTSDNAFIPVGIYDLTDPKLDIRIVFHSTLLKAREYASHDAVKLPGGERVYVRSPQYEFGWDWGPRFINMGIRKPVYITLQPQKFVTISGLTYTVVNKGKKNECVNVDYTGTTSCDSFAWKLAVFLNGNKLEEVKGEWNKNRSSTHLYTITHPQKWWPNGSGEHNYYEFELTAGTAYYSITYPRFYYAFCDIELVQEADEFGESFFFKVNGRNIYAKGANYIPDDSFEPGKNTQELVRLAKEANMNMLRVWGGGTYPDDDFYIECMKNGIMVWQDFIFACAMYPGDTTFISNVQEEVGYHYKRLKNYNHIALWCGNNENDEGWKNWGWQKELNYPAKDSAKIWNGYVKLFDSIIPYPLGSFEKIKNYIPSSPKYGWGRKESMTRGDSHYWGVWWGLEPVEKYEEKVPRFMSEFGMQGMPQISTLKKVIPDSAMNFHSPLFKNHQKHPTGFQTIDHYLDKYLTVPDSMEDYMYATQVLQAYSFTTAIEAQRRSRNYCMGSLIWQLNDCWPVTSWSVIDYDLKPKIAYDAVKDAFKPVIVSVAKSGGAYKIYVVNDGSQPVKGKLTVRISDFYGNTRFVKTRPVLCKAGSSKAYLSIPEKCIAGMDTSSIYMQVVFDSPGTQKSPHYFDSENYHFVKFNQLKLPLPDVQISNKNGMYRLSSKTYCPYVILPYADGWIFLESLSANDGVDFLPSDNFKVDWVERFTKDPAGLRCLNTLFR